MQQLVEIKNDMNFLLTLQPDEVKGLFKANNGYAPFIEKAYNSVSAHPEILPTVFDTNEFTKDYTLIKDLTLIANLVNELANSIQYTMMAASSDTMSGALEIYAAVKQNRDKVPGLNVAADEMSIYQGRQGDTFLS